MNKKILLFVVLLCMTMFNVSYGATKEDVISALNNTYIVAGEEYRLPEKIRVKGTNYLNKKELPSENYAKLLDIVNKAVEIANRAGTTNVKEIPKEDLKDGLGLIVDASRAVDLDLDKELAENDIELVVEKVEKKEPIKEVKNDVSESNKNTETSNEQNVEKNQNFENIQNSGSGEIIEATSGDELPDDEYVVQEKVDLSAIFQLEEEGKSLKEINSKVNKYVELATIGLGVLVFLLFFINLLIFRSKWNKIIKCILIILFLLLFIASLVALILMLIYMKDIKTAIKLYYMFL